MADHPDPGSGNNFLFGVAVVSANDIWAVGDYFDGAGLGHTLTEHWDGTQWSVVPSPNPPGQSTKLFYGVAVVSANDVWAVGRYFTQSGNRTLTEHWDGTQWSIVPSPSPGASSFLWHVAVVSSNDVWAVGASITNNTAFTLTEHWNGSAWSVISTPNRTGDNFLQGVAAVSANDVWAVGNSYDGVNQPVTLVEHWDGSTWSIVPSPNVGPSTNELHAVTVVSANDVWAVGTSFDENLLAEQTLTEHWDGTTWNVVPSPSGSGANFLFGIAAVSANDIWSVGWYGGFGGQPTLTMHWDGTQWSIVSSPSPGSQVNQLWGVAAASANDVWAVGNDQSNYIGRSVIERYNDPCVTPSPTPSPVPPSATATATRTAAPPSATTTRLATNTATPTTPPNTSTPTVPVPTVTPATPAATATRTAPAGTATASSTPCTINFSDVHPSDYFYEPVLYLACHGVVSGYSDGTFRPYNFTTRAQMVKIVVLGFQKAIVTPGGGNYTFHDVTPSNNFFAVIETAAADGIVSGYTCGGPGEPCDAQHRPYFRPYNYVTRGQLSKIDVIAAQWVLYNPATPSFTDVPPGSVFYEVIETAHCHGVVDGYNDGTFRPYNNATRGQIAKIVYLSIVNPPTSCGP